MAENGKHDKWILLARKKKNNNVRRVWTRKNKDGERKFKISQDNPNPDAGKDGNGTKWKARIGKKDVAKKGMKWAEDKGYAVYMSKDKWPFLVLEGGIWGNSKLSDKMQRVGIKHKRYLRMGSYKRDQKQQHELYLKYIRGTGNLAAYCNTKYRGEHSWEQCKKYPPCASNHCGGNASDASYYHQGRSGNYTNLGYNDKVRKYMKQEGLCLPVSGEKWHCEIGTTWRS